MQMNGVQPANQQRAANDVTCVDINIRKRLLYGRQTMFGNYQSQRLKKHEVLWRVNHGDYGKRWPMYQALEKVSQELGGRG
jgi:hypothetical protein